MAEEKLEEKPKESKKAEKAIEKGIGVQLGNINKKRIFCGMDCPNCPKKKGAVGVQIRNILKNGKLVNIVCANYTEANS